MGRALLVPSSHMKASFNSDQLRRLIDNIGNDGYRLYRRSRLEELIGVAPGTLSPYTRDGKSVAIYGYEVLLDIARSLGWSGCNATGRGDVARSATAFIDSWLRR